jgi:hypothetical protein
MNGQNAEGMQKCSCAINAIEAELPSLTPASAETTGLQMIQASKSEFRVCADPENLPFTNHQGEGFKKKIAELLAQSANQPLTYYW